MESFIQFLEANLLSCFNKQLFGFDCFGCGMQRAVILLLKGEFLEAFKMNAAIYPFILLMSIIFIHQFYKMKYILIYTKIIGAITALTLIINFITKHFLT